MSLKTGLLRKPLREAFSEPSRDFIWASSVGTGSFARSSFSALGSAARFDLRRIPRFLISSALSESDLKLNGVVGAAAVLISSLMARSRSKSSLTSAMMVCASRLVLQGANGAFSRARIPGCQVSALRVGYGRARKQRQSEKAQGQRHCGNRRKKFGFHNTPLKTKLTRRPAGET